VPYLSTELSETKNTCDQLIIGALAKAAEVNVETIRFYQRKGLLSEPERPLDGIRRCGAADAARVRFVKAAKRLGFSLDEIAQLLSLEDSTRCEQARTLGQSKLADVRARIAICGALRSHWPSCCTAVGQRRNRCAAR